MRPIDEHEKDIITKHRNKTNLSTLILSMVFIAVGFLMRYRSFGLLNSQRMKASVLLIIGFVLFIQSLVSLIRTKSLVDKMEVETIQVLEMKKIDKKKIGATIMMETSKGPQKKTVEIIPGEENVIAALNCGSLYYVKDKPYYIMGPGSSYYY